MVQSPPWKRPLRSDQVCVLPPPNGLVRVSTRAVLLCCGVAGPAGQQAQHHPRSRKAGARKELLGLRIVVWRRDGDDLFERDEEFVGLIDRPSRTSRRGVTCLCQGPTFGPPIAAGLPSAREANAAAGDGHDFPGEICLAVPRKELRHQRDPRRRSQIW
jgi:hypothetical protein